MKIFDLILNCFQNLLKRKMRTMLTLLGVLLGSASVALTFSLGEAVKQNNQQLLEQNANLQYIQVFLEDEYSNDNSSSNDKDKKYLDDKFIETVKEINGVEAVRYDFRVPDDITFLAGKNDKYHIMASMTATDLSVMDEFGFKLKNGGKFPDSKASLISGDNIDVVLGEDFEYFFYDWKYFERGNNQKAIRAYSAPSMIYESQKYGGDSTASKSAPPFVDISKDDIFLSLKYTDDNEISNQEVANENSENTDKVIVNDEKDKTLYKKYKVNCIARLDWDCVKDNSDVSMVMGHACGAYVNIETGKKLVQEYKKLNKNNKAINPTRGNKEPEFVYDNIIVKAKDINHVANISKQISRMGYQAINAISTIESEQLRTRSIQFVFGILGGITLFVSALSIANTMITSVYERTREIGIMKVLGCKIGNIQFMFLIESAIMGLVGGVAGMGASFALVNFMNRLVDPQSDVSNLGIFAKTISNFTEGMKSSTFADEGSNIVMKIAIIKPELWIWVIVGTTIIGLVAGYIPSVRASRVSALKAMKSE